MNLKNKNILITGGARRVGAEIVRRLAVSGANMVVHYHRSAKEATELQNEIEKQGGTCRLVQADLGKYQELMTMVEVVLSDFPIIDCLICNAAVFPRTPFFTVTEEEWDSIIAVNLKSHFFLAQRIGKQMIEQNSGKIVLISDVSAESPWPNYLPYTVSKAGLNHLVAGLAKALAPNVQVNGVAPGTVLPPEDAAEAEIDFYRNQSLLNRIGTPDSIARAVQFLLESSDFITGAIIPVDGGYRIKGA